MFRREKSGCFYKEKKKDEFVQSFDQTLIKHGFFAATKFAPFHNLPQSLLFYMKNLSFHHFF